MSTETDRREPTLLADLEQAYVELRAVADDNNQDTEIELNALASRLRAAATRLREEMERAATEENYPGPDWRRRVQAMHVKEVLARINGGGGPLAVPATPPMCRCDKHEVACKRRADYLVTRAGKRIAVCDKCTLPGDDPDDRDLTPDWEAFVASALREGDEVPVVVGQGPSAAPVGEYHAIGDPPKAVIDTVRAEYERRFGAGGAARTEPPGRYEATLRALGQGMQLVELLRHAAGIHGGPPPAHLLTPMLRLFDWEVECINDETLARDVITDALAHLAGTQERTGR